MLRFTLSHDCNLEICFNYRNPCTCFVLSFAHEIVTCHGTLSFLICCLYAVDWSKVGWVHSWVADIQFDSTICASNELLDFFFFFCFVLYVYKSNLCFHMFAPGLQKDSNDASDVVTQSFSYPVVTELIEDHFWGSKDWYKLKSILVNRLFHIKMIILIYVKIKRYVLTMGIQLQLDNIPEGYISKLHASTWPTVITMCHE